MRDGARRPTLKAPFPHCRLLSLRSLSVHLRRLPDARRDHSPRVKKHLSHTATFSFSLHLHVTAAAVVPPIHPHTLAAAWCFLFCVLSSPPPRLRTGTPVKNARLTAPLPRPPAHGLWPPVIEGMPFAPGRGGVAKVLDCLPSGTFWTSFWYSLFGNLCTQF